MGAFFRTREIQKNTENGNSCTTTAYPTPADAKKSGSARPVPDAQPDHTRRRRAGTRRGRTKQPGRARGGRRAPLTPSCGRTKYITIGTIVFPTVISKNITTDAIYINPWETLARDNTPNKPRAVGEPEPRTKLPINRGQQKFARRTKISFIKP